MNMEHKGQVLALDIGGTNTRIALVEQDGTLTHFLRFPSSQWNKENPLRGLIQVIETYLKEHKPDRLLAVALGVPGAVDRTQRFVVNVPTIPSLDGTALADELEAAFRLPVYLDRDVVMLYHQAAHELRIPGDALTACFFIGTGLGNLLVFNGVPYTGDHGIAGELGHIPLQGKEGVCGCGQRGCAELYMCGHGMVALRNKHYPGEDPDLLFTLHVNEQPVQDYLNLMADVIATEMIILDPGAVLFGGGIIQMPDFPFEMFVDKVSKRLRSPDVGQQTKWYLAKEAQKAGVIGAGLYAFGKLSAK
ncbi:MAG: allose kinase [Clostridiales bacterium]|jgi:allose kinase|nr:allose kinase [Clostridiales bacterium]